MNCLLNFLALLSTESNSSNNVLYLHNAMTFQEKQRTRILAPKRNKAKSKHKGSKWNYLQKVHSSATLPTLSNLPNNYPSSF